MSDRINRLEEKRRQQFIWGNKKKPVDLWTRPADQSAPYGTYGQADGQNVDNAKEPQKMAV